MTAEEFVFWQEYFSYYPFTFDREDERHAELISYLTFIEGRQLKTPIKSNVLIPDYLGNRGIVKTGNKTLEQQEQEFKAFHSKLKSMSK